MELISPNFRFLKDLDPALFKQAAMAKRYCLARAFRGEMVPQDPNDEPVEKMLE